MAADRLSRIAQEAALVLSTSTPTPPSAARNLMVRSLATHVIAVVNRDESFGVLRRRCRKLVDEIGAERAGDVFDALSHAIAVTYEGEPEFMTVVRGVAEIGRRLEAEFVPLATAV